MDFKVLPLGKNKNKIEFGQKNSILFQMISGGDMLCKF